MTTTPAVPAAANRKSGSSWPTAAMGGASMCSPDALSPASADELVLFSAAIASEASGGAKRADGRLGGTLTGGPPSGARANAPVRLLALAVLLAPPLVSSAAPTAVAIAVVAASRGSAKSGGASAALPFLLILRLLNAWKLNECHHRRGPFSFSSGERGGEGGGAGGEGGEGGGFGGGGGGGDGGGGKGL